MRKKYTFINSILKKSHLYSLSLLLAMSVYVQAQNFNPNEISVDWDICKYYPTAFAGKSSIKAPNAVLQKIAQEENCSEFIVTYNGFTTEAQAAFQFAVDIWSVSIESTVPIRINANFSDLGANVLGSAGPASFVGLTGDGVPSDVAFPIALAEALIGGDVDDTATTSGTSNDINANFSSTASFYFGLDANPPGNQIDFVSVVLHELGHGLGFLGFGSVPTTDGDPDPNPPVVGELRRGANANFIAPWDQFIENGNQIAITSFADPSSALLSEFTSNNLFSNGPTTTAQNGGVRPSMFAPTIFNPGSSYSHWDESTYPAGDANSLMTPTIGRGEAIHDPGVVMLGIMQDMGWVICANILSVNDFEVNTVSISPNPFTESITITLLNTSTDKINVQLLDINGRIVRDSTEFADNGTITISNLNELGDALYFAKITNQSSGATITREDYKELIINYYNKI